MKPENYTIPVIRSFLKDLSVAIRIKKQLRKLEKNQQVSHFPADILEQVKKEPTPLLMLRYQARHYHVAYSEFRGNTRSQIENKSSVKPDEKLILSIKEALAAANPPVTEANPSLPEVAPNV